MLRAEDGDGRDGHVWVCLSLLRHVFEMFVLKRCEGGKGEARQQQAEAPESSGRAGARVRVAFLPALQTPPPAPIPPPLHLCGPTHQTSEPRNAVPGSAFWVTPHVLEHS